MQETNVQQEESRLSELLSQEKERSAKPGNQKEIKEQEKRKVSIEEDKKRHTVSRFLLYKENL